MKVKELIEKLGKVDLNQLWQSLWKVFISRMRVK